MHVTQLEWIITLGVTIAVLLFDVVVIGRRPHEPSKFELVASLTIYIGLAVAFGVWVYLFHGSQFGVEFFAGWLTEYSLSVDPGGALSELDGDRRQLARGIRLRDQGHRSYSPLNIARSKFRDRAGARYAARALGKREAAKRL